MWWTDQLFLHSIFYIYWNLTYDSKLLSPGPIVVVVSVKQNDDQKWHVVANVSRAFLLRYRSQPFWVLWEFFVRL